MRVASLDQKALVEYRYRAVREVLAGSPIGEVAARYGTSRQSVPTWRRRSRRKACPGWPIGRVGLAQSHPPAGRCRGVDLRDAAPASALGRPADFP